ncbi:MAG: nucleoside hydrolase, partial [Candidatus Hydrogenedentes bacterium]|nr:nucleoside hydrolase [Candidatus Hydrogenedentota bacterium]
MPRHLVLDCDPGCDDALAIFMALDAKVYSRVDVLTVAGNVGVEQTTANAVRILYLASECLKSKPTMHVYKGCQMSLDGVRPSAASVHGRDGLGDVPFNVFAQNIDRVTFGEFRAECLEASHLQKKAKISAAHRYLELLHDVSPVDTKRDLVCIGPLTNIASALLQLGPEEQRKFWTIWERVVIMGGALGVQGNISHSAEFNCHADPLAMKIVLDSIPKSKPEDSKVPIFVTLDCTEKVSLLW